MIDVENIPKNGQILVVAYFKEYSSYMQNESRKLLKKSVPTIGVNAELELRPLFFGILRDYLDLDGVKKSRPVGVLYSFSYRNMTPYKYRAFYRILKDRFDRRKQVENMWSRYDVLVAAGIGGL